MNCLTLPGFDLMASSEGVHDATIQLTRLVACLCRVVENCHFKILP
jgi:hypothetical protein